MMFSCSDTVFYNSWVPVLPYKQFSMYPKSRSNKLDCTINISIHGTNMKEILNNHFKVNIISPRRGHHLKVIIISACQGYVLELLIVCKYGT